MIASKRALHYHSPAAGRRLERVSAMSGFAMKIAVLFACVLSLAGCHRGSASGSESSTAEPVASARTPACQQCLQKHCSAVLAACTGSECSNVRTCIQASHCGDTKRDTLVPCYCGAVDQDDCFFGKAPPAGPCKAPMEIGAKTTNPLDIGQRYFDMAYATGQAVQLTNCETTFCKECR